MYKSFVLMCLLANGAMGSMIYEVGAEVDYYNPSASGDFSYTQNAQTTNTRFNNQSESSSQIGVYLEHPIPVIPNIRIDFTPKTSFRGLDGGQSSTVSITQTDIIPYYEVVDTIVDFDLGVAFRVFEGSIQASANQSISAVIPMGYASLGINIPSTNIKLVGDIKYAGYHDDTLDDMRLKAIMKMGKGLQVQAGYRHGSLDVNDHLDMNAKVTIKGPFVGLGFVF